MAYAFIGTVHAAPLSQRLRAPSLFGRVTDALMRSNARRARREINARRDLIEQTHAVLGDVRDHTAARPFA